MPFIVGESVAGDVIGSDDWWFVFRVNITGTVSDSVGLECIVSRIKPAHTVAWINYV